MKDIEDMVQAYEESLRSGNTTLSPKQSIQEQVDRFRAAQEKIRPMIQQVRLLLGKVGVPTLQYTPYVSYAMKLQKLCGVCGGAALLREAQLLTGVWVGRGLSPEVLSRIRSEVFEIPDLPGQESPLPE